MKNKLLVFTFTLLSTINAQQPDGTEFVIVTPKMNVVLEADPVYQFIHKVNEAAGKDAEWNKCFPCATYKAFVDESTKHYIAILKQHKLIK